jgi:hypothetical protein
VRTAGEIDSARLERLLLRQVLHAHGNVTLATKRDRPGLDAILGTHEAVHTYTPVQRQPRKPRMPGA